MKDNKVVYEIKLEKSLKVILGIFALGIILNVVSPGFPIKEAFAELKYGDKLYLKHEFDYSTLHVKHSGSVSCK